MAIIEGKACVKCGGTLRYDTTKQKPCVACARALKAKPEHLARKRERAKERRQGEDRATVLAGKRASRERNKAHNVAKNRERNRLRYQRGAETRAAARAVREAKRAAKEQAKAERRAAWLSARLTPEERALRRSIHDRNKRSRTRAAIRGTSGKASNAAIRALRALQHGRCAYCLAPAEHLDHKTPLARGGLHTVGNLQWLCAACNQRKHAKTDAEYRALYGIVHAWPLVLV